mgnify:CR=1 FL=1
MKIWIVCDHSGYPMKLEVLAMLQEQGYTVEDMGCDGSRADYPEIAASVGKAVAANPEDKGILICGTGIGMSIAANKVKCIRAAVVSDCFTARAVRMHNDANVLCLGARVLGSGLACLIAQLFVETEFEGGRHQTRLDMIRDIEEGK